jgi:hypothetical protein
MALARVPAVPGRVPGDSVLHRYANEGAIQLDASLFAVLDVRVVALRIPVCGELLILGKSVIRHTQAKVSRQYSIIWNEARVGFTMKAYSPRVPSATRGE